MTIIEHNEKGKMRKMMDEKKARIYFIYIMYLVLVIGIGLGLVIGCEMKGILGVIGISMALFGIVLSCILTTRIVKEKYKLKFVKRDEETTI